MLHEQAAGLLLRCDAIIEKQSDGADIDEDSDNSTSKGDTNEKCTKKFHWFCGWKAGTYMRTEVCNF